MINEKIQNMWSVIHFIRKAIDGESGALLTALRIFSEEDVKFNVRAMNELENLKTKASNMGLDPIVTTVDEIIVASNQEVAYW